MTKLKKQLNGDYYIEKRDRHNIKTNCDFRACASSKHTQSINLGNLYVPEELFGKKLRFRVEIIEE